MYDSDDLTVDCGCPAYGLTVRWNSSLYGTDCSDSPALIHVNICDVV